MMGNIGVPIKTCNELSEAVWHFDIIDIKGSHQYLPPCVSIHLDYIITSSSLQPHRNPTQAYLMHPNSTRPAISHSVSSGINSSTHCFYLLNTQILPTRIMMSLRHVLYTTICSTHKVPSIHCSSPSIGIYQFVS